MENTENDGPGSRLVRGTTYLLMLLFAFSITMIGPLVPVIIKDFKLQLADGGLISTFQNLGGLMVTVLLIFIADRYKKSYLLMAGFLLYIVALFVLGMAPAYWIFLFIFFLLGVGTKAVDTLTNAFLSEQYPETRTRNLNLLHMFFGIGALLGPLYTRYLMDYGFEWRIVFKYLGFAGTVVLVLFIFAVKKGGRTEDIEHKQKSGIDFSFFLSEKKVWVMFMILFLYVGHQSGINIWLPMYMEESMGVSPRLGSMSLSIFWTAIITGRFLVAKFGSRLKNSNIIRWGSIAGAIILTAGIVAGHPVTTTITTGIAGLLTGAFIPLVVDTASGEYPEYMGMVTSILFLAINLSMMFFPWLVGLIAQNLSFQMGMMVTSLVLVGTFFLSFNIE